MIPVIECWDIERYVKSSYLRDVVLYPASAVSDTLHAIRKTKRAVAWSIYYKIIRLEDCLMSYIRFLETLRRGGQLNKIRVWSIGTTIQTGENRSAQYKLLMEYITMCEEVLKSRTMVRQTQPIYCFTTACSKTINWLCLTYHCSTF